MNSFQPKTVDPTDPFASDALDLLPLAENLTRLVEARETPMTLTLSSPWGQGKTTFVHLWNHHLRQSGHQTIYFDAWTNDYADDPFVSFLGTMRSQINAKIGGRNKFDKLIDASRNLAKASPKIAINYALAGGLRYITDYKGDDASIDGLSQIAGDLVAKQINSHETAGEALRGFQEELKEYAESISKEGKPLVIFVDELDRCKPSYSVNLLETIKHIFSVQGVVFVLAVDQDRLGHAASHFLGFPPESAGDYLSRFVDINVDLPSPDTQTFASFYLKEKIGGTRNENNETRFSTAFACGAKISNQSLRNQQRTLKKLGILFDLNTKIAPEMRSMYAFLLAATYVPSATRDSFVSGNLFNEWLPELNVKTANHDGDLVSTSDSSYFRSILVGQLLAIHPHSFARKNLEDAVAANSKKMSWSRSEIATRDHFDFLNGQVELANHRLGESHLQDRSTIFAQLALVSSFS